MKLEKVVIENFQSVAKATVYLSDRGLVSVEGKNLDKAGSDSNGSGKSTLINAILWCNYDDAGKKFESVDEVVRFGAKGGTMVACYWYDEDHDVNYVVTRYRKHPTFKNTVTLQHQHVLGSTDLTKGTNAETQLLINQILGADKETFKADCFAQQTEAPDIPGMTDGELKGLLEKVLPFDNLKTLHQKALNNLNDQKHLVDDLRRDLNNLNIKLDQIRSQTIYQEELSLNWNDEVTKHRQNTIKQIEELGEKIVELTISTKPQAKLNAAHVKFRNLVDSYDPDIRANAAAEYKMAYADFERANNKLETIDLLTNCGACGQSIGDRALLEEQLKKAWDEANERLEKALEIHKATDEPFKQYKENYAKLQQVESFLAENARIQPEIARLTASVEALEAARDADQPNPYNAPLKALVEQFTELQTEEFAVRKNLEAEERKLPVLEAVVETYSPKGVRYHILETVTPVLTNRTNYYLAQLTDGAMTATWSTVTKLKNGDYREKFSIKIAGKNFGSYGSLSGGEQRKVKLACFFALQDVIASRATKRINLWCGDEIDHALDPAGLERLMNVLHEKTKTKSTIVVISHNVLREWIPNYTIVSKSDGISSITGYLSEQKD